MNRREVTLKLQAERIGEIRRTSSDDDGFRYNLSKACFLGLKDAYGPRTTLISMVEDEDGGCTAIGRAL